jgi:Skp family chaperone for outer membrane proteins
MAKKISVSLLLFIILSCSQAFALEIPLSGAVKRSKSGGGSIVFVDMERVFNAHPMSERFKNELKNFAKTRKNAIEDMIRQHDGMQGQFKDVSIKITEAQTAGDDVALSELAMQIDSVQKSIEEQKAKIADLSRRTKLELSAMEEKNSFAVLKDIEIVLKEVSKKRDSEIVLDKQSVLCASDTCEDITDEVIKKLEGR